jgi:hypothetical protein
MQMPKVTEISALSAHRREVALVRWSLLAVPEEGGESASLATDPLRSFEPEFLPRDRFLPHG